MGDSDGHLSPPGVYREYWSVGVKLLVGHRLSFSVIGNKCECSAMGIFHQVVESN